MSETNETKKCKYCQSDIPKKAKICPNCKKKQGGIVKWIVIAIVVFGIIGAATGGSESENENEQVNNTTNSTTNSVSNDKNTESNKQNKNTQKPTPTEIAYEICSIDDMMEELDSNALRAETNYQDKYVEVTGKLNVIDSDGKYITIVPDVQFAIMGIQCKIKNDEQKKQIVDMSIGDIVTVKGKITDIGEIIGYHMNLDSIE